MILIKHGETAYREPSTEKNHDTKAARMRNNLQRKGHGKMKRMKGTTKEMRKGQ